MIHLLPYGHETLVMADAWSHLGPRLEKALLHVHAPLGGWVYDHQFEVQLRTRRAHAFIPVVRGEVLPAAAGCILFLDYTLAPGTRVVLTLWSGLMVLCALGMAVFTPHVGIAAGIAGLLLLVHAVAWGNFRLHRRTIRTAFLHAMGH